MSIHKKPVVKMYMLRKKYVFSTNEVYHISVVNTRLLIKKGGVIVYRKFDDLLKKNNKTAYRVSKDTGIAQSVFSDWKTGRSNPKVDKLKILADYFGVKIEYFIE